MFFLLLQFFFCDSKGKTSNAKLGKKKMIIMFAYPLMQGEKSLALIGKEMINREKKLLYQIEKPLCDLIL